MIAGFAVIAAIALGAFDKVQWKWLSTAGAITYPLYLIHMFVGMTLIHHFRNDVPAGVLLVSVTVLMMVVAWLIHRLVERPAGKWLRDAMRRGVDDVRRNTPARNRPRNSLDVERHSPAARRSEELDAPVGSPVG